jgi:Flp pilus assembly protein TadG
MYMKVENNMLKMIRSRFARNEHGDSVTSTIILVPFVAAMVLMLVSISGGFQGRSEAMTQLHDRGISFADENTDFNK